MLEIFDLGQRVLKGCIDDLKLVIDSLEPVDDNLLLLLAKLRFRLGPRLESTGIKLLWQVENIFKLVLAIYFGYVSP